MKLTFKDLETRSLLVFSEEEVKDFTNNILNIAKETILDIFKTEATSKDIEEFVITNILETVEHIDSPQDAVFICQPTDGAYFYNVICNKKSISIDLYTIDVENKKVDIYSTYEIVIKEDNTCDISFKIIDTLKEIKLLNNDTLPTSETSTLLRLGWYTLTLFKKQNKN